MSWGRLRNARALAWGGRGLQGTCARVLAWERRERGDGGEERNRGWRGGEKQGMEGRRDTGDGGEKRHGGGRGEETREMEGRRDTGDGEEERQRGWRGEEKKGMEERREEPKERAER